MKKNLLFIGTIVILIVVGFFVYKNLLKKEEEEILPKKEIMPEKTLEGKNIAMIIAFRDFRDVEYFIPRDTFLGAGAKVVPVSTEKGIAIGADGGDVDVRVSVDELKVEDFDAIVFIGGPGMAGQLDNPDFHRVAKEAVEKNKVLGAICIAPAILAKAGVLEGKKATVWSSPLDKSAIRILEEEGAIYQKEDVVVDGKFVTASGPPVARKFAEALIEILTSQ